MFFPFLRAKADSAGQPAEPVKKKPPHQDGVRDAVESIVFAFLLALIFKTFEAEMFVIPTGSMAPTLYGRHKEATCRECGQHITVGASGELDRNSGRLAGRVTTALCPNCGSLNDQIYDTVPFNGDRICVTKFPYEFSEPDRWDVFVFKYPADPQTNYIKRLVGLPGETIRLRNGNAYLWDGEQETILRKPLDKQRAIQIPVHDNSHVPQRLLDAGWPERWAAVERSADGNGPGGWSESVTGWSFDAGKRNFTLTRKTDWQWVRYRHFAPYVQDWRDIEAGRKTVPLPRLVSDFCSYNAFAGERLAHGEYEPEGIDQGPFWNPDLTLECQVTVREVTPQGELLLELCEGTAWYRCRMTPATGQAVLEVINAQLSEEVARPLAERVTPVQGPGTYQLAFANVDDRLALWVNGRLVDFGPEAELDIPGATANPFPTKNDLAPLGIAARELSLELGQLKVFRDIYYRGTARGRPEYTFKKQLEANLRYPEAWAEIYGREGEQLDSVDLVIPEGHFLALGDNSPESHDSRLWDEGLQTVPREFLVGKAFFVYWPHGVPFLNNGKGFPIWTHVNDRGEKTDYPVHTFPFYPQFWRMKLIR